MAETQGVSVESVRAAFATALRGVSAARDAWISAQEEGYDLWLLIEPTDMTQERQLYTVVDPLYDLFPTTGFMLHILNPSTFERLVPESIIPPSAVRVGGSAAA